MCIFDILPIEIQQHLLLKCHYNDIINYGFSCKKGLEIIGDDFFWRNKALLDDIPMYILKHDNFNLSKRYGQILNIYGDSILNYINITLELAIVNDDKYIINYLIENKKLTNNDLLKLVNWSIKKKECEICEKLIYLLDKENTRHTYINELCDISIKLSKKGMVKPLLLMLEEIFQTNKNYKVFRRKYIEVFQQTLEYVCEINDLNLVKILVENFSYWPDYLNMGLCTFIEKGNMEGFQYLLSKYTGSDDDLENFLNIYDLVLNEEALKLLAIHGFKDHYVGIFNAINNNNYKIIDWLLSNYKLSNVEITLLLKIIEYRNIKDEQIKNVLINLHRDP